MERTTLKLTRVIAAALLCAAGVTTASSQPGKSVDFDALAARGETLSNEDPLALELRNQQPEEALRGFYIGMGVADGQTALGPGKARVCASLLPSEQQACSIAVLFSVDRNRNANRASVGAAIARVDSVIAEARNSTTDVFYRLGFDIATGIFGDPTLGAQGNTSTGPGSLGIRDSLSPAGQRGFNDSVALNLSRRVGPATGGPSSPIDRNSIEIGPRIQPPNTIRIAVRYKKEYGYKYESGVFAGTGPSSCSAFSVSAKLDSYDRQRDLIRITNEAKMRDSAGFYICDYLVSELPLNQPIRVVVSIGDARSPSVEAWLGGSQPQPPSGYQRTILDGSRVVTLTDSRPSASLVFEMIYDMPPLTSRPPL